ncbi:MAG: ABC transporter substrate-binding protein [Candidatus Rokuibacteriota bacterium]
MSDAKGEVRPAYLPRGVLWIAVGLVLAAIAGRVDAQPPRPMPVVGYLSLHALSSLDDAFALTLRDLGWVEGQNVVVERRVAEARPDRLPRLVAELLRARTNVIVATSTPAALAAKRATTATPIVFTNIADPIGAGLVTNLARPTANLTGLTTLSVELSAKRLEMLKAGLPHIAHVTVLRNPASPQAPSFVRETEQAAGALGLEIHVLDVGRLEDLEPAFRTIPRGYAGAVLSLPDPMLLTRGTPARLAALAASRRVPLIGHRREMAEAGALLSYGPEYADLYRRAAVFVDRILRGAKPSDLPVEQPTRFELVVNLKTARELGLAVPPAVLARADRVIDQ